MTGGKNDIEIIFFDYFVPMVLNFKDFMVWRSDCDCDIGVIAHDLLNDEIIPWGLKDEMLFQILDNSFEGTPVFHNWMALKTEYLTQE